MNVNNVEDFLKTVGFDAPEGFTLNTDNADTLDTNAVSADKSIENDNTESLGQTIKFTKKDMSAVNDNGTDHFEIERPLPLGHKVPVNNPAIDLVKNGCDIRNNTSPRTIVENKLNENYTPKNLTKTQIQTLNAIKTKLLSAIKQAQSELTFLNDSLSQFGSSLVSYIDTNVEFADILKKYTFDMQGKSSFGLPGVFAGSVGAYDKEEAFNDSRRLSELQGAKDDSYSQEENSYSIVIANVNDLLARVKEIKKYSGALDQFINSISEK